MQTFFKLEPSRSLTRTFSLLSLYASTERFSQSMRPSVLFFSLLLISSLSPLSFFPRFHPLPPPLSSRPLAVLQIFFLFRLLSSFFLLLLPAALSKFRICETGHGTKDSSPAAPRLPRGLGLLFDLSAPSLGAVFDDLFIPT